MNRAKTKLKDEGIQARKNKKARLTRLKDYAARNEPPEEDLYYICESDKELNQLELATCTEEFYSNLIQAIQKIEVQIGPQLDNTGCIDGDDNVVITTVLSRAKDNVSDYIDSSPPRPNYIDSSDVKSRFVRVIYLLRTQNL